MKHRLLLLLILSIGAFLRLYQLTSVPPGLYRDEAMNGSNALEALETRHFEVFYPENGGREGLYIDVAAVSVHFWGNRAWVLRLPAAIFGILTIWGVYLLATELASVEIGLLAAFFLATSFWHINFSRMAFRAIAAPLLLTWALYLLLVSIRCWREGRPYLGLALLAGAVYGLGFYTYIGYRVTPLLVAAVLLYKARDAGRIAAVFASAATLLSTPLIVYFARHPGTLLGRAAQVSVLKAPHPAREVVLNLWRTGRMFFTRGDTNWRHNIAWRAELFWPVAILLVVGVLWGGRKGSRPIALFWLAVASAPVVFTDEGVPHALRGILMLPPVAMLAAEGLWRIYGWVAPRAPRGWLIPTGAALFLLLAYEPYSTYFRRWARNPNVPRAFDAEAVAAAGEINLLPRETPKYVVVADPMAAQPVMFLTGSYTEAGRQVTNIHYVVSASCQIVLPPIETRIFCLTNLQ